MPRLVILIALLFLAWLGYRWFMRTPPEQVSRTLKQAALWGVAIVFIALAATGRLTGKKSLWALSGKTVLPGA
jgi:TRAP-type C4-dicarboxylate transport system permease small subunit